MLPIMVAGMTTEAELIRRIETYCATHKVAASTFGRKAVNDGKLVDRLRAGKSITLDTLRRIEAALAAPEPAEKAA